METWEWPQYVFAVLYITGLLFAAYNHGKPKRGINSFWPTAIGTVIGVIVLYFGGFWT